MTHSRLPQHPPRESVIGGTADIRLSASCRFQCSLRSRCWASAVEGRESTTLQEHDRIVVFLESHDALGAVKMMGAHLGRSDPLYEAK